MLRCILSIILITLVYGDPGCPTGYSNYNNQTCYKVFTTPQTRTQAEFKCEKEGGFLGSPTDGFDNAFMNSLGKKSNMSRMWIGVQCFQGTFAGCGNDDDSHFQYRNFNQGNPKSTEHCIYLSTDSTWSSSSCMDTLPFICALKSTNEVQCIQDWYGYNGMCYKVINNNLSVLDAENYCKTITGGNLATVASPDVGNQFLAKMTVPYNIYTFHNYFLIGAVCPNAVSNGDTSSCYWIDSTKFKYSNFQSSRPLHGYPYVMMLSDDGTWNVQDGTGQYSFIYQAPPLQ